MKPGCFRIARVGVTLVAVAGLSGCLRPTGQHAGATLRVPPAPTAEQVRAWAGYPESFQLSAVPVTPGPKQHPWGKLMWGCHYGSSERSLVDYQIALFEPGTLWGTNRAKMIERVEQVVAQIKSAEIRPDKDNSIDVRPDGSKAYFCVMVFGPGGGTVGGFAFHPQYDLLVLMSCDYEDDTLPEKRMKDPVVPAVELPDLFKKIEEYVATQVQ
jgi:hypothetical protein